MCVNIFVSSKYRLAGVWNKVEMVLYTQHKALNEIKLSNRCCLSHAVGNGHCDARVTMNYYNVTRA